MLVHAAIYAYNSKALPRHLIAPSAAMTVETLPGFYTKTPQGLRLNVDAVKAISTAGEERA